jgi:hypothetical protein
MLENIGKMNALLGPLADSISEEEKRILGITVDPEPHQRLRANAERAIEEDGIAASQQHVPLSKTRSTDRKDLYPWQGKESDGEIMFNFENLLDAQDLYDFVLETQLVTPGEVKLKVHESGAHAQYSVHFAQHVLVIKPDVIQMALIAYQDQLGEGAEEAYEELAQAVDAVLTERSERGSAEPRKTGRSVDFNPFHDKRGVFTSRAGVGDGGSWSDGKKVRLKATHRGNKLHFAGTKRPCGREARGQGKDMRCWDGKPGLGFALAQAFAKKQRSGPRPMPNAKKEDWTRADRAALQECWDLYGVDATFQE